jgi:hypothetical protein
MLQFEDLVWYFGLLLMAAVLGRLYSLRLVRRYPALACCMGLQVLRAIPHLTLNVNTNAYALTYMATVPLLLLSYVWVAVEIHGLAFRDYQGLSILGRRVMLGVLGISAGVAIFVHLGELDFAGERFQVLRAVMLVESAVSLTLLIFLIAIASFLIWYPAGIRKNLLVYSFSFSFYMAAQCGTIFLRNSNPSEMTRLASIARLSLEDLSVLAIAAAFSTAGEHDHRPAIANLTTEHGRRLLAQLSDLSTALENKARPTHSL